MKKFLTDFVIFYKNPTDERINNYSIRKNLNYVLYTLLLKFAINIFIISALIYLINNKLIPEDITKIDYSDNTFLEVILITALLLPILEELVFRFPLRYNRMYATIISRKKWGYIFKFLVYAAPLSFGLLHLTNFEEVDLSLLLLAPILVGSQIIAGFLYTFLRVRFNFLTVVCIHIFWNFMVSIFPVVSEIFDDPYQVTTDNYSVKIESFEYNNIEKQKFIIDSSDDKIYRISAHQYSINHITDSITNSVRQKGDFIVNFELKSTPGISKKQLREIIHRYDKEND